MRASTHMESSSKQWACILGGALGDAMGYRVEFMSSANIFRTYGAQGITLALCTDVLEVSDDTQMTLFTLEGLCEALAEHTNSTSLDQPLAARITATVRRAYLDWYQTQRSGLAQITGNLGTHASLHKRQAPGLTCLSALESGAHGTTRKPINDSKGCGGVMRVAPVGFWPQPGNDAWIFQLGCNTAALTHGHPDGYLSAGAMAVLVHQLCQGADWLAAIDQTLVVMKQFSGQTSRTHELLELVKKLARQDYTGRTALQQLGLGWVGEEALAVGLYAAMVSHSLQECLALAANHDGDSDSTASVAGQLYGARHGMQSIPAEPLERLDVITALRQVMTRWIDLMSQSAASCLDPSS